MVIQGLPRQPQQWQVYQVEDTAQRKMGLLRSISGASLWGALGAVLGRLLSPYSALGFDSTSLTASGLFLGTCVQVWDLAWDAWGPALYLVHLDHELPQPPVLCRGSRKSEQEASGNHLSPPLVYGEA